MATKEVPAISGVLGPVRQLGFVVRDLDRALEYWTKTLGVGPFFTIRNVVPDTVALSGTAVCRLPA